MSGSQWEFYGGDDYLGGKEGGMSEKIVCTDASPRLQAAKARTAAVQASNATTRHLGDFAIRITQGRRDIIGP